MPPRQDPAPRQPAPLDPKRNADGSTTWTSPLGRVHTRPGYWSPPPTPRPELGTDPPPLPDGADGQLAWQLLGPVDPGLGADLQGRVSTRAARLAATKKAQCEAAELTRQTQSLRAGVDLVADPWRTTAPSGTPDAPDQTPGDEPPF